LGNFSKFPNIFDRHIKTAGFSLGATVKTLMQIHVQKSPPVGR
jgi:hypothetical protein